MSENSTHSAEVFHIQRVDPHPNADKLEIVRFFGYQTCVGKGTFKEGDLAVFIPPDTLVRTGRPEFDFLANQSKNGLARIKAMRLRGEVSQGLIVPAPEGLNPGDDAWGTLELSHYNREEESVPGVGGKFVLGGEEEAGPDLDTGPVKYDIESLERYGQLFDVGELVEITEKLDGSNCRYVYWNNRFYVKSRNRWVKRQPDYSHVTREYLVEAGCPEDRVELVLEKSKKAVGSVNSFWTALENNAYLVNWLKANPGFTVFGELFGSIGKLKYDGGNRFAVFDVYRDGRWMDRNEWDLISDLRIPVAPLLDILPFDLEKIKALSSGPSALVGPKFREGIVVKPLFGRQANYGRHYGRLALKCVSPDYLAMKGA